MGEEGQLSLLSERTICSVPVKPGAEIIYSGRAASLIVLKGTATILYDGKTLDIPVNELVMGYRPKAIHDSLDELSTRTINMVSELQRVSREVQDTRRWLHNGPSRWTCFLLGTILATIVAVVLAHAR
jgi:hypothetical protein